MTLPLFDGFPPAGKPRAVGLTTKFVYPNRHGSKYTVTVTDVGRPQVSIRCDCPAFKYGRWKECRHVTEVAEKEQLFTVIGGCLVNYPGDRR